MTTVARTVNTMSVTEAQLTKCHRIVDGQTHEVFYLVESATEADREYKVTAERANGEFRLHCTIFGTDAPCPAEAAGRICWHKRASLAHAAEYKATQKTLALRAAEQADSCRHCGRPCRRGICPRCAGA
jgi:hypothetical protein